MTLSPRSKVSLLLSLVSMLVIIGALILVAICSRVYNPCSWSDAYHVAEKKCLSNWLSLVPSLPPMLNVLLLYSSTAIARNKFAKLTMWIS